MAEVSDWVSLSPEEIEDLVAKLAREGNSPSEIGMILRDKYAIPSVKKATGKTVTEILESHDLSPEIPEGLMSLIEKAVDLFRHLERNPKDLRSQRSLDQLESRIQRLTKYYRRKGRLPPDWRYNRDQAELLVRG